MRIFADVLTELRDAVFIVSLLTAAAYARWHLWQRTGWGRTRMMLLLSLAALTLETALRSWTSIRIREGSAGDHILSGINLAATAGVLITVTYMLCRIVSATLHRVRHPGDADARARRYLARTPGATREDIEKLTACWDETHGRPQRLRHHVGPAASGHSAAHAQCG